jgi:hypothetical protein
MSRLTVLAVAAYVALVASLPTALYEPLYSGRDDSWAVLALVALAHAGLGAAVGSRWVLAVPVAGCAAIAVIGGGLNWLALFLGAPVLVAATGLGLALGHRAGTRRAMVAAGCFALALLPAGWAAVETLKRGPHVSPGLQAALPTAESFGKLLPGRGDAGGARAPAAPQRRRAGP